MIFRSVFILEQEGDVKESKVITYEEIKPNQ